MLRKRSHCTFPVLSTWIMFPHVIYDILHMSKTHMWLYVGLVTYEICFKVLYFTYKLKSISVNIMCIYLMWNAEIHTVHTVFMHMYIHVIQIHVHIMCLLYFDPFWPTSWGSEFILDVWTAADKSSLTSPWNSVLPSELLLIHFVLCTTQFICIFILNTDIGISVGLWVK